MNGYLIVDKPEGMTSFEVVRTLRKCFQTRKIGHGGTLDPMVTGVLPVFIGNATRAIELLPDGDKTYDCTMKLGVSTDTEDLTGTVLEEREVNVPEETVRRAVLSFAGDYLQTPPMYSAKKINGRKLYNLARNGETVERTPERKVIRSISVDRVDLPFVRFHVTCSKGTYVRTLTADIGRKLGTLGAMAALRRIRHGRFSEEDAIPLDEIVKAAEAGRLFGLVQPTEALFSDLKVLSVLPEADRYLQNGNKLNFGDFPETAVTAVSESEGSADPNWVRIAFSDGKFGAIYAFDRYAREFLPVRMFLS